MTTKMADAEAAPEVVPESTADIQAQAEPTPSGEVTAEESNEPQAANSENADEEEAVTEDAAADGEATPQQTEGESDLPAEVVNQEEAAGETPVEEDVEGLEAKEGSEDAPQAEEEEQTVAEEETQGPVTEENPTEEGDKGEDKEGQEVASEGQEALTEGQDAEGEGQVEGQGEGQELEGEMQEGVAEGVAEDEHPSEVDQNAGITTETIDEEEGEETAQEQVPMESENFAEGERAESPVAVGEKLSREATPSYGAEEQIITQSPPIPGTPDREYVIEEGDEDEEDEEEEPEPQYDRDQLIERYHQALAERQQLQEQNHQLQHRLAEHFRKKKSEDIRQDMDKNVTDQEQRYLKYMANLDELRHEEADEREQYIKQIDYLSARCEEKQDLLEREREKFTEFKKQAALGAINSRSGKPIPPKDIEQYLANEGRKETEVAHVRLENIKLKNKLRKKEHQLKSKEELAEGLHLIDFEQLKIENQTYNEKIEERNEELMKLRKKITNHVQVLTHLKEKLQFVQAENHVQKSKLRDVEELAARKRDILSRTKQARDALRIDNNRLRQNCGLLGNEPLLRDFEDRKDEGDDLKNKLEELKVLHAELTLNLNGVRRKIEQAREGQV